MDQSTLAAQLEAAIENKLLPAEQLPGACQLLVDLKALEDAAQIRQTPALAATLERIRTVAQAAKSTQRSEDVLYKPFASFCSAFGFPRGLVSSVDGDIWRAESLYVAPDIEPAHTELKSFLRHKTISLREAPLEARTRRRGAPELVTSPLTHSLTYKPLMRASNSPGYVVSPIVSCARIVGLVHIDRFDKEPTHDDLDKLSLLSETLGLATEEIIQRRRFANLATRVEQLARSTNELYLRGAVAWPDQRTTHRGAETNNGAPPEPVQVLTRRQRQILKLIGQGATNTQIAREIGVAEATIKSHITAILSRLGVASRAEAMAVERNFAVRSAI